MLYVSVLLASFTIRFYPLSYLCYTYIHAYAHLYIIHHFCFTRFFSSFSSLTFSFLFTPSSFSPDTLTIDYATSWQIYVVLATVSCILGHGGCLQLLITYAPYYTWASCASQGVSHSHRASGGRQEECEDSKDRPSSPRSCNPSSSNVRFACRCNKAL